MKNLRFAVLFTVLALVLALVPGAFAQDGTFGLGEADFALFSAANANSASATSFTYEFALDLAVTGIEDGEATATINGSGAMSSEDGIAFSLVTEGTAVSNGEETPTNVEIRVIGDMLYVNTGEGWQGAKLEDVASIAGGAAGLPISPEDMMSGDMSDLGPMGDMMGGLAGFDPSGYISIERLDDADGLAHFSASLDVAGLLASDELSVILGMAVGGAMGSGDEMTAEEAGQMGQMLGMMFGDASVTLDQYVNVDTEMVERAVLSINFPLENLVGEPGAGIMLTFDIQLSAFGEAVSIEVPADVEIMESGS